MVLTLSSRSRRHGWSARDHGLDHIRALVLANPYHQSVEDDPFGPVSRPGISPANRGDPDSRIPSRVQPVERTALPRLGYRSPPRSVRRAPTRRAIRGRVAEV